MCDNLVEKLLNLDTNDSIDTILVSLNSLLNRKILSVDDILSNVNLILSLSPDKYHSARNTIEFLGIWEEIHNPDFNYVEFAIIKSQAGLK